MNIIITMAGLGSRFRKAGYNCPKYMIVANGKSLFEWSMDSLLDYNTTTAKYIFIVRKEDSAKDFIVKKMKNYHIRSIEIIEIDYLTDGQATTALIGVEKCNPNDEILIFNIDTYIEPYSLKKNQLKGDGHIPCFKADGTHWSFVKEENGKVVDVVEKVRISDNCSLGAYYFKSASLFREIYNDFYSNSEQKSEKYIAPMYKHMLNKGLEVTFSVVDYHSVHVLGTPDELNAFIKK